MSVSSDRSSRPPITASRAHRCAHAARSTDHLSRLGTEVIAHRLRTLGHPTRLGLLRALDRRQAGVEQLADELGEPPRAIAAHLRVLCRAGIVCRTDRDGPAEYRLADWPSLWLVDQLASRLRERTAQLDAPGHHSRADGDGGEGATWR